MTSKRRKWVVAATCAVAAIALWLARERDQGPTYQGKTLSTWLAINAKDFESTGDGGDYLFDNPEEGIPERAAPRAIRHIGTNALPYLLEWVRYDPSEVKIKCKSVLNHLPSAIKPDALQNWINMDPDAERAVATVYAFKVLGEQASPAIPELSAQLTNADYMVAANRAAVALAFIGEDAFPHLSAYLANTNAPNYGYVGATIAGITPLKASGFTSLLIQCLNNPHKAIHNKAAISLAKLVEHDQSQAHLVVPALTTLLGDTIPAVRIAATNALLKIAPEVLTNAPPQ